MAKFEKGHKLAKGRPPGSVNRSTEMMRLTIARATNTILDTLATDLQKIKEKDPKAAIDIALKLLEFNLPKQSRVELKGEIDARIQAINVNITQKTINEPGSQHND
jgi:hypothetical protein